MREGIGSTSALSDFEAEFKGLFADLDARPQVVADHRGRVVWSNDTAGALLSPPLPLVISNGCLNATSEALQGDLRRYLLQLGDDCESLLLRVEGDRHWARLRGRRSASMTNLVFLVANLSIPHRPVDQSGLAQELNLTPTETRVLDEFSRLNAPKEIAESLDVSLSTVRSHLKQIHAKAGVETSVQLTQLVQGYCFD